MKIFRQSCRRTRIRRDCAVAVDRPPCEGRKAVFWFAGCRVLHGVCRSPAKMLTAVLAMHAGGSGALTHGAPVGIVAARSPRGPLLSARAVDWEREDEPPEGCDFFLSAAYRACRKNPAGEMRSRAACRARSGPRFGAHSANGCAQERSPAGVPHPYSVRAWE